MPSCFSTAGRRRARLRACSLFVPELDASGFLCDILRHITNGCVPGEGIMSVRKREWVTSKGEVRQAFIVDYTDQEGNRHIRTFDRKGDATDYAATVKVDIRQGVHTASKLTVAEAAEA